MSLSDDPVIDVLIPVYNGELTIQSSVESIQRQTVKDIRILVIDDGSTDQTKKIIAALAAEDPRIELICKPHNSGIVDTLNEGLARCRAPYLARHDADDLAYPNRFEVQLNYLEQHSNCLAVGAAARHVDANGIPTGGYARCPSPDLADFRAVPSREPYLMHPFLMVRLTALKAVGGYRYVFHAEDTDLYWRLQERGHLYNPPEVLGDYRLHGGSITSKSLHNGRIGALNSQLAAISAGRRRNGRPDIAFCRKRLAEYEAVGTAADLLRIAADDLASDERAYLEVAFSAKLLESASYRLYMLDQSDCKFIRRNLVGSWHRLSLEDCKEIREKFVSVGIKMFYHRHFRELATLLPTTILSQVVRRVLGYSLRARLASLRRR